jgi:hypothetical protein
MTPERNEISRHEIEAFSALTRPAQSWKTNAELGAECPHVAQRTMRAITLKLVKLGILDQAEVFPAHKFRLADKADKRNRGYVDRLHRAAEVFGVLIERSA